MLTKIGQVELYGCNNLAHAGVSFIYLVLYAHENYKVLHKLGECKYLQDLLAGNYFVENCCVTQCCIRRAVIKVVSLLSGPFDCVLVFKHFNPG